MALTEQPNSSIPVPLIRMSQECDQLFTALRAQVDVGFAASVLAQKAIYPPGRRIDLVLIVLTVRDVVLVHVGHVERSIGGISDIYRPECGIGTLHHDAA